MYLLLSLLSLRFNHVSIFVSLYPYLYIVLASFEPSRAHSPVYLLFSLTPYTLSLDQQLAYDLPFSVSNTTREPRRVS